ncbi:MAG: metal ABC transporter substrate-binding protein [Thermodesulfovibrionales bacterium]
MLLITATPALAKVNVVATLPFIGSIAREIGKDKIEVNTLIKPSQDPHFAEAKPSMILAARKADILMFNGLDLEVGYLPRIVESSNNPKIQPGKIGNFDCSQFVSVVEKPTSVDRSMGDVHPLGNPHYVFSPKNILNVAEGISVVLSELDSGNAGFYKSNFQAFRERLAEKQRQWSSKSLKGKKFVSYHKYYEYLAQEFGFQIIAYVEPKPGIPPSAGYLADLVEKIKRSKPEAILTAESYGKKESEALGQKTGSKVIILPHDVGNPGASDWLGLMDTVINSLP